MSVFSLQLPRLFDDFISKNPVRRVSFTSADARRWRLIVGYTRVSTTERNLGLRHDDLKPAFDASVDQTDARCASGRSPPAVVSSNRSDKLDRTRRLACQVSPAGALPARTRLRAARGRATSPSQFGKLASASGRMMENPSWNRVHRLNSILPAMPRSQHDRRRVNHGLCEAGRREGTVLAAPRGTMPGQPTTARAFCTAQASSQALF